MENEFAAKILPDCLSGKLTVYMTTQAPHAIRTVFALVAGHVGLAEHKIQIIAPDIGGGFGGKVPVYPGYVIAVAASVLTGKPVKLSSHKPPPNGVTE